MQKKKFAPRNSKHPFLPSKDAENEEQELTVESTIMYNLNKMLLQARGLSKSDPKDPNNFCVFELTDEKNSSIGSMSIKATGSTFSLIFSVKKSSLTIVGTFEHKQIKKESLSDEIILLYPQLAKYKGRPGHILLTMKSNYKKDSPFVKMWDAKIQDTTAFSTMAGKAKSIDMKSLIVVGLGGKAVEAISCSYLISADV